MPVLFFMPWIHLRDEVRIGQLRLVPYRRERTPGNLGQITQTQLDAVLGNYGERSYAPQSEAWIPIRSAVLLDWDESSSEKELEGAEIDRRLAFADMLRIAALAQRTFGSHLGYVNSDELMVIGQQFSPERPSAVSVATRRRDGGGQTIFSSSSGAKPRFVRPLHVSSHRHLELDVPLFLALEAALTSPGSGVLLDAVALYVRANTDSDSVSDSLDLVLMRAAFETILKASHEVKDLRYKLVANLKLVGRSEWAEGPLAAEVWRSKYECERPIAAWVQDFCAARNQAAHGRSEVSSDDRPIWSDRNHLMFSSWLFPFVVKNILATANFYRLTDDDLDEIANCELFLSHDISHWDTERQRLTWQDVEEAFDERRIERFLRQQLERQRAT